MGDDEPTEGLTDEDAVPELPVEPRTKMGDVWLLDGHRLLCGSSTESHSVELVLNGQQPNTMITDPPYGVKYEADWRAKAKGRVATERENNSNLMNDDQADWYDSYVLFPGTVAYVWHASSFTDVVMDCLRRAGFEIKQQIIWNKNVHALSRSDYHWKHEPCWYAAKPNGDRNWKGGRTQMTVWDIKSVIFEKDGGGKTSHPTQKPVEIYTRALEHHTNQGEYVYEPFGGSGTSIIACEKLGRRSLAIELDPKYCDVIVKRWQDFTGKQATLESTGELFDG
ncbi:Methyltransferase (modular protein) [Gammaproteobacteria bacterium]